jgi:hypothetical protein
MVPSESAPQELSNEWSCQYVSTILNILGNFCVLLVLHACMKVYFKNGDPFEKIAENVFPRRIINLQLIVI